jgi:WD40 repeat protein
MWPFKVKSRGAAPCNFCLGLTLYEFIALRPAFDEKVRNQLIKQVTNAAPVRLSKLNRAVPRDLETIVHKAIDREPARRYQTSAGLAADLQRFIDGEPIKARPLSSLERLMRWCGRNPMIASLAAAVMLVTVVGFGATLWQMRIADGLASEAEANLYVARMNLAQADWENANVGRILETLGHYRQPPAGKRDPRGWEWYYQHRLCQLELRTLRGHTGAVTSVAFNQDGSRLASASQDGTIKVWDAANGQELLKLKGLTDWIYDVAFSPDGSRLASGSDDQTIMVWNTANGQELLKLEGHTGVVLHVAFSPDGNRLASSSADGTLKIWDTANGQVLHTFKRQPGPVWSVAFSPDGSRLASTEEKTIRVWDTANGQELFELKGHTGLVESVAFNPDGNRLASASGDGTIKVWDTVSRQELRSLEGHTGPLRRVAFSPDGSRLASAGRDQTIKVWDAATGRMLRTLKGHTNVVESVAFSPDGSRLASASWDLTIKVWEAASGQEQRTLKGHTGAVLSVAFSLDGSRLASASQDQTIKVWETANGFELRTLKGHTGGVSSVAFSPDGSWLASAGDDGAIKVWDATSGQELRTLKGHTGPVRSVAFSPDGRRLASAGVDQTIKIWDTANGRKLGTLEGHTGAVLSVAFSPDGSRLASASQDGTIKVWDAASGQPPHTLNGRTTWVAFSPDGSQLASEGDEWTIKLWATASGQLQRTLKGHIGAVSSVAFSPDGSRLASASADGTIKVWDATRGQELRTLKGTGPVGSVAFSPDGSRLASWSGDQTIRLWDARPWTPELRRQREAVGLVDHLCQKFPSTKEKVAERIRADKGITEEVRHEALALLDNYWPGHLRHQLADNLFTKKWNAALPYADQLLVLFPKEESLYAARAEIRQGLGRLAEAAADLTRAVKLGATPAEIKRVSRLLALGQRQGVIQDWLVLGPVRFKEGQGEAKALADEQLNGEANLKPRAGETSRVAGSELTWKERHLGNDFQLDFVDIFRGKTDYSVAYAVCYLFAEKKLDGLKMLVGSDDGYKIYLNGNVIHEHDVLRRVVPDEDTIDNVTLKAARNILVFKVVNGTVDWGGCIRFVDRTGLPAKGIRVSLAPE